MEDRPSGASLSRSTMPAQGRLQQNNHIRINGRDLMCGWQDGQGRPVPPPSTASSGAIKIAVSPTALKAMTSAQPIEQSHEFKSALLEYSKAVIKSGMDWGDEEAQSHEANIITTREKVIATHDAAVSSELNAIKSTWIERERQLTETITIQGQGRKYLEGELRGLRKAETEMRKQSAKDKKEVQKYKALWEKGLEDNKKLEDETAQLKNESRKRRRVEEIWERAEKVKMD